MRKKLFVSYLFLGFLLLQYQNCAPSAESLDQTSVGLDDNLNSPVDGIDQINVGSINFPQSKVTAFMNDAISVVGVCGQSGSLISWNLASADGTPIERGLAECQIGSFEVSLSDSWQNYCGQTLELNAALGAKAASHMEIEASCQ